MSNRIDEITKPNTNGPLKKANDESVDVAQAVDQLHQQLKTLREQLAGIIVGQNEVSEQLLIAMLCRGHCILQGMPGLAKTMLVSTMASVTDLTFRRVQFTPDLMPGDITGTEMLEEDHTTGKRIFRFVEGPLFGNMILADEINRTPPKTQSALLEAMQERQLTVCGQTYKLPDPFFVLATQNPVETEGTYPLPEAQLDRFLLKIHVEYPSRDEEREIARRQTTDYNFQTIKVLDEEQLHTMQSLVRNVVVADHVYEAALDLVAEHASGRGNHVARIEEHGAMGCRTAGNDFAVARSEGTRAVASALPRHDGRLDRRCPAGTSSSRHPDIQCRSRRCRCRFGIEEDHRSNTIAETKTECWK